MPHAPPVLFGWLARQFARANCYATASVKSPGLEPQPLVRHSRARPGREAGLARETFYKQEAGQVNVCLPLSRRACGAANLVNQNVSCGTAERDGIAGGAL